ncbi:DUF397 domain-containing protein [Streptomyces sp. NPDC052682]
MRDSKHPRGPAVSVGTAAWQYFADAVADGLLIAHV